MQLAKLLQVTVAAVAACGLASTAASAAPAVAPLTVERNTQPKLTIVSVRMIGQRVYARLRICDDSRRNVSIFARDSRAGVKSYTRRFATKTPPRPCGVYSRSWQPAPRFLSRGSYVVTLWARDAGGLTSRPVQTTFLR